MDVIKAKPALFNTLFLSFIKSSILAIVVVAIAYFLGLSIQLLQLATYWYVIIFLVLLLVPLTKRIIFVAGTTYYFHNTHITSEFNFIIKKRHSVPYSKITDIKIFVGIWDRITKAGDLIISTADDEKTDMVLVNLPNHEKIEKFIHERTSGQQVQHNSKPHTEKS